MNGKVISGLAAILVLFLFFMPWVAVSCDGLPQSQLSGFQLVASSEVEGFSILLLVPLTALISLFLLMSTLWKSSLETKANWGVAAVSVIGLVVLLGKWLQVRSENNGSLEVSILPALGVTVAALIAIGLGAVFDLLRSARPSGGLGQGAKTGQLQWPAQRNAASETWVDEGFQPRNTNATIVDEGSPQVNPNLTVVDDGTPSGDPNLTVVDDTSESGKPNLTIVDDGAAESPHATIVDDSSSDDDLSRRTFIDHSTAVGFTSLSLPKEDVVEEEAERAEAADVSDVALNATTISSSPPKPVERTELLNISRKPVAWLVIANGEREGESFELAEDTTIGRDPDSDIFINDTALSALHTRVKLVNGRFIASDQNSTNGLYVFDPQQNSWEKEKEVVLQEGTQLRLGRTDLHFTTLQNGT